MQNNPKNIFQNVTLQQVLEFLVERYGFEELGRIIQINSFVFDPSIKSSLKFLRRTPWARAKVEELYMDTLELDRRDAEKVGHVEA